MVLATPVFQLPTSHWHMDSAVSGSTIVLKTKRNKVNFAPLPSTDSMDQYVFTFPPVTFTSAGDSTCPAPLAFTSHDYRNPSHAPFPPDAAQPAPQRLVSPDPSYGYPAVDPALLAISIPQLQSSLTSRALPSPAVQVAAPTHDSTVGRHPSASLSNAPSTPGESIPSPNPTPTPDVTVPSIHADNYTPTISNGGISVVKAAGNKSTWATRNPGLPVMQPRQPLSAQEKEHRSAYAASRKISAAQRQDRDMLLNDAIHSLADEVESKVQAIAATHCITDEKVKKLLGGHKYYRNSRGTQLANAIIHDKAHEVNEAGRVRGEKLTLQQIRDLAKADPKYQDMTQDEKDELLRALTEYRALKNTSVRATNSAAARDAQSTLEHVFKILDGLALRTGIYPFWYGTDNVMDFWEDVMDLEPDEIVRKLEQWACVHGKNMEERNSVEGMQRMCACILNSGLRVVAKKKIRINFVNFEVAIKEKHGIDLLGWPEGVPFQSPHAIMNAEHLRSLRDALKAGTCRWAYMSRQQRLEYQDRLKERRTAGEVVGKARKKRSDVGKKRRRTAQGKGPKSTAIIDSSSEENSSTEEDDA
ncbi:hypothetical protein EDD15DRAFT_2193883 [Pisolithus albus]|nr:hypothetical protein EDD15DRAFT_2193883 [Pisolithus albus]